MPKFTRPSKDLTGMFSVTEKRLNFWRRMEVLFNGTITLMVGWQSLVYSVHSKKDSPHKPTSLEE